ncbi:dimethylsulfoxide reductase subunit B [Dermatophilus congolensis]|uniref:DMSO/selenate family reductase complex B subunit n=1 Tax=Dermatophilus congolensis TaxID=1863 RepID=UPI001AAF43FF|nr:DMSO/selenate family reductase complex B subunit [Dermatophilus congolensis]MBO3155925.1 dimethylsulfoxide reductase subunit B [Dermatophilus congolensis]MBO3159251.1 dimethylsulfoxide reductase subunit B [Dermatophilus congolensis]MBO3164964.1 dimethylsulfoxide reductase subunit B [Dermatophilus congolensis]MBO3170522.1 dimethylsulfoxide reductase subunit B [Dermatophilus congolensis]MBO3175042.1 dimethylsulfoxide reductase subunit B [Dermatophilus congolensis]
MQGFAFDQSACNGCKACQIACKDKHSLPIGVKWRRVVEYTGGSWSRQGETLTPNVFSYYTSISCNHCADPICVEVCPTTAMTVRQDGIVYVEASKCVGCRYCEWACPYSVPQFNAESGHMSKCDGCYDYRQAGKDPACVAACPSRALAWGEISELKKKFGPGMATAPLPDPSTTRPNLVVKPHKNAQEWNAGTGEIANLEEI